MFQHFWSRSAISLAVISSLSCGIVLAAQAQNASSAGKAVNAPPFRAVESNPGATLIGDVYRSEPSATPPKQGIDNGQSGVERAGPSNSKVSTTTSPPNVILLMADDMGWGDTKYNLQNAGCDLANQSLAIFSQRPLA